MEEAIQHARQRAIQHARENTKCRHFGVAIMVGEKHVDTVTNEPHIRGHAEMCALARVKHATSLIIIRITKDPCKPIGLAKPCYHCIRLLKESPIESIYYTTDAGELVHEFVDMLENNHVSSAFRGLVKK